MAKRLIVLGDSIAYGKWDTQGGWVARLREKLDIENNVDPKNSSNLQVYNLSIPGDLLVRAAGRLEIELKSRMFEGDDGLVIVAAGINDSNPNNWLSGKQTPKKDLQAAIVKISEISKKYSCETIVLGLTPVNEKNCDKYFENNLVEKYNNYLKEVCTEREIKFIDVYEELKISDFIETLGDGVHPDDSGHEVLFDLIKTRIEI